MALRTYALLAAAGALLAAPLAVTAEAATTTHKPMHHTMTRHAAPHRTMHGRAAPMSSPANADHSADSLNAQSLQRAQAPQ